MQETIYLFHTEMRQSLEDAEGMGNSVDHDQMAPVEQFDFDFYCLSTPVCMNTNSLKQEQIYRKPFRR